MKNVGGLNFVEKWSIILEEKSSKKKNTQKIAFAKYATANKK